MAEIWLMLAAIIYVFKGVDSQDCISIEAAGYNGSPEPVTWSVGIEEIQYNIRGQNCSRVFNLTVLWTEDYGGKTPKVKGNISSTDELTNNGWNLTLYNLTGNFSTVLTMLSEEMEDSFLIVHAKDRNITTNITFGNCSAAEEQVKYNQERTEDCEIASACGDGTPVYGKQNKRCGKFTRWVNDTCKKEYVFDLTSTTLELNLSRGVNVTFLCNESNFTLPNGTEEYQNVTTLKMEFHDHGKNISCGGHDSTINILSVPTFEQPEEKELSLRIPFKANPPVSYSDISVSHLGNAAKFFFRHTDEISYEILLHFPESYEKYNITVIGQNETCHPQTTSTVVQLTKTLTLGWISTICVGSFAFLLLIGLIVAIVVACRRKGKQGGNSDIALVNTQTNKPRNSHAANQNRPVPALPTTSQSHVNTNYSGYDDDEFDDDYENMDNKSFPVAERPPMPLPSSAHDGGGRSQPARSPRHSPRLGYEQPRRGVPQPHSVGPPRGSQGLIPQQPNREASLSVSPDWTSRGGPRSPGYGQEYPNDSHSTMTLPMQQRRMYDQPPVPSNRYR